MFSVAHFNNSLLHRKLRRLYAAMLAQSVLFCFFTHAILCIAFTLANSLPLLIVVLSRSHSPIVCLVSPGISLADTLSANSSGHPVSLLPSSRSLIGQREGRHAVGRSEIAEHVTQIRQAMRTGDWVVMEVSRWMICVYPSHSSLCVALADSPFAFS